MRGGRGRERGAVKCEGDTDRETKRHRAKEREKTREVCKLF